MTPISSTWTLTAAEARPGHELHFNFMVEHGVSTARAFFAYSSANVEGGAVKRRIHLATLHAAGRGLRDQFLPVFGRSTPEASLVEMNCEPVRESRCCKGIHLLERPD